MEKACQEKTLESSIKIQLMWSIDAVHFKSFQLDKQKPFQIFLIVELPIGHFPIEYSLYMHHYSSILVFKGLSFPMHIGSV